MADGLACWGGRVTRDRAIDVHGVVHLAEGTKVYLDTGHIYVKTLCTVHPLKMAVEKTSKPIPATCFVCLDEDARLLRWYEREMDRLRTRRRRR